ncbi:MAG: hypothetical protein EOO20_08550 [Chryseobacterium sp.]|nr:MAG: hypothetical protein EOO20_08550 [Chryseobacterium sp.]
MEEEVFISGIETLEWAAASKVGSIADNAWKRIENITPDSVSFVENNPTKTSITPEDKDVAVVNFYAPSEGDILNLSVLSQNPELLQELYNVDYTAATSTFEFEAKKKISNLAFRITSRPTNGIKTQSTYFNTEVTVANNGNKTKTDVEKKVLAATILSYRPAGKTKDYVYRLQYLTPDGDPIDATAP